MRSSEVTFMEEEKKDNLFTRCMQKRIILAGMGFWCFFVLSALRLNISLAIVAMVKWSEVRTKQTIDPFSSDVCHYNEAVERPEEDDGPFLWNTALQGHILSCYFYGLAATQLLGGRLSEMFSAKWVLLLGTLAATLATLLMPILASDNAYAIMFLQVIKGLGQGIMMPSFAVLMGKWIPAVERARFMSCIASGMPVGGFITVILAGFICKAPSLGWKYVFYIFGAVGALWCLFWWLLIHDSPLSHPNISRRELNRIMSLRSQQAPILNLKVPLKCILTSKPVWGYFAVGFASFWALSLYISVVPLFMGTILKFDIKKNGLMSAIPNLVEAFFLICTSLVSDYLLKRKILKATAIRKIFISIGLCGYAICMIAVTFTGCNRSWSVFFLVMALGMCGFNFASTAVVPVDMSPRFAGTISGIMSTFGAMSGIVIPSAIGYLTKKRQSMSEWSIMFYLSAAICVIAVIIYVAFGSSETQFWNNPPAILPSESESAVFVQESSQKYGKSSSSEEPAAYNKSKLWEEKEPETSGRVVFMSRKSKANEENEPGPSSGIAFMSMQSKPDKEKTMSGQQKEQKDKETRAKKKASGKKKKSQKSEDRPWRTDSFPDAPSPHYPAVNIPHI